RSKQARPNNRMRAKMLDAVEVQLHLMAAAAERDGGMARIGGPEGVIRVRTTVEVVLRADIVEGNDLAVVGLRHQPDMEPRVAEFAFAAGGKRHALVGRKPVADDAVFVLGVSVV